MGQTDMELFSGGTIKDIHIIQLARHELLLESIVSAIGDLKLSHAVVLGAVGSLRKLVYHQPVEEVGSVVREADCTIEEPMEILSLSGTVMNSVPHFHIVVSGANRLYGGHVKMGTEVLSIAEITVASLENLPLERRMGPYNQRKLFPYTSMA
jgi:hypothetical protein